MLNVALCFVCSKDGGVKSITTGQTGGGSRRAGSTLIISERTGWTIGGQQHCKKHPPGVDVSPPLDMESKHDLQEVNIRENTHAFKLHHTGSSFAATAIVAVVV